ncbi:unnamed protein product [Effrenium voratum]|nr:unnamed protein product [Effrenium voratum]
MRLELLQRELEVKRQSCEKLRHHLAATRQEKETVVQSCLAGVEAAQAQMAQMRAELEMLKQAPKDEAEPSVADEEEVSWRQMKLLECRNLRHELSKWRHQVATLEAKRPQDEAEVARLKVEVMHAQDVLESTRHAVRHLEVEQSMGEVPDEDCQMGAPTHSIEVVAERHVRERAEERGSHLAQKAKRLGQVILAQKLLIQRLEKQIITEESLLEQKEMQLAGEEKLHIRLKVALRQRSDEIVVDQILGKLSLRKEKVKRADDTPKSDSRPE